MRVDYSTFYYGYTRSISFKKKPIWSSRFSRPSNYKFSKFHSYNRDIGSGLGGFDISSSSFISSGTFVQFINGSRVFKHLTSFQFKSLRNLVRKPYKSFFMLYPQAYLSITRKPGEVRMGKGKGSKVSHNVFPLNKCHILGYAYRRSNSVMSDFRSRNKFRIYFNKFPVPVNFFFGSF